VGIKLQNPVKGIDIEATSEKIHETMTKFVTKQLTTWVTVTTQPIPVWTGATRATFIKLAEQAGATLSISPKAPQDGRLRGIDNSQGELIAVPVKLYGWEWTSHLPYTDILNNRHNFIEAGAQAIKGKTPRLPQPVEQK
jgi:hypothetical protein